MSYTQVSQNKRIFRSGFTEALASGVNPDWQLLCLGTGQTVSQSGSNLVIGAGTTANAETILRSNYVFSGSFNLRHFATLSQRIANNSFIVELVDIIRDNVTFNIVNATTLNVVFPQGTNPFTRQNIGQSLSLGNFVTGVAAIPGRYAIANVNGDTVTFTVAGFPTSGTGTVSLFGWNFYRVVYDGTTATNALFDAGMEGYATGNTTMTIVTTASPGHMLFMESTDGLVSVADQLAAATTGSIPFTQRALRNINVPLMDTKLVIQIRAVNGTTAPASNTTLSMGFIQLEQIKNQDVTIVGMRSSGFTSNFPVTLTGTLPAIVGQGAEDAAVTGSPVRIGGQAYDVLPPSTVVNGDAVGLRLSRSGQTVVKGFAPGDLDFSVQQTVTTNAQTQIRAAQAAGIRQNITAITYQNTNATATTLTIQDGSTTLITFSCPASMANPVQLQFPTPLRGTAATALNYIAGTTGANVLLNTTGFNSY